MITVSDFEHDLRLWAMLVSSWPFARDFHSLGYGTEDVLDALLEREPSALAGIGGEEDLGLCIEIMVLEGLQGSFVIGKKIYGFDVMHSWDAWVDALVSSRV